MENLTTKMGNYIMKESGRTENPKVRESPTTRMRNLYTEEA
jgi:hypothetical protein